MARPTLPLSQKDKEAKSVQELMKLVAQALSEVPGAPEIEGRSIAIVETPNSDGRWSIGTVGEAIDQRWLSSNMSVVESLQQKYKVA